MTALGILESENMLKIKVTFRIFSSFYTLSDISKFLGEPDKGFSAGDSYGKSNNKREMTLWAKKTKLLEADTLESHIKEVIKFINGNSENIKAIKDKCNFDIFCMLSSDNGQGGASLQAAVFGELYNYGVGLTFDVYSGG